MAMPLSVVRASQGSGPWVKLGRRLLALLIGGFCLNVLAQCVAEGLWFQELGYLDVYERQLLTRLVLLILGLGLSAAWTLGNLRLARQRAQTIRLTPESALVAYLLVLGGVTATLGLVVGITLQAALEVWRAADAAALAVNLPLLGSPDTWGTLYRLLETPGFVPLWVVTTVLVIRSPRVGLSSLALLFSVAQGVVAAGHWARLLLGLAGMPMGETDPEFGRDLSFYLFQLPLWDWAQFWGQTTSLFALLAVLVTYLRAGRCLSEGCFPQLTARQANHLRRLGALGFLWVALGCWLYRYDLLYSPAGATYGASYTDIWACLPLALALGGWAAAIAIALFLRSLVQPVPPLHLGRSTRLAFIYLFVLLVGSYGLPALVQRVVVQPNEFERERPYIQRTLEATRHAFNLDTAAVQTFNPNQTLAEAARTASTATLRNIRVWDTLPLLEANRQLQQIRLYYRFPGADVDRYRLLPDTPNSEVELRQVLIAARELETTSLPPQAQTWVNRHLVYTHGYGFTVSPVNLAAPSGLPEYFVKDIGPAVTTVPGIPVGRPAIYYGEATTPYVLTGTQVEEFDYPQGDTSVYTSYTGRGGIALGSPWRRWLFAWVLRDWRIALTDHPTPATKLLWRRTIRERVTHLAPFLYLDSDPYLVAADLGDADHPLHWMMDAYTTSRYYPYSDPGPHGLNYLRSAVKIQVDAYHGSVRFYAVNTQEPLTRAWQRVFPTLFQPLKQMPPALRQHNRYPQDLFQIQAERLLSYHMTDAQGFYNREDQWSLATEIYGTETRSVAPYYLIMKLPEAAAEEFLLFVPFTPAGRPNLTAWLVARSDGEAYGQLRVYTLPKESLFLGPEQLEALINQEPLIAQQISLWNRAGLKVTHGRLLIITLERALLYVEPLYLEAEPTHVPILARVVAAADNRIVMAVSSEAALERLNQVAQSKPPPAIVRDLPVREALENQVGRP